MVNVSKIYFRRFPLKEMRDELFFLLDIAEYNTLKCIRTIDVVLNG